MNRKRPALFRILCSMTVLVGTLTFPLQLAAQQDSESEVTQFAQGLRARRLFDIAESYCLSSLTNPELDPTTQAALTLELIRTRTAKAAVSSGSDRQQAWQLATQAANDFIASNPNHPRRLLVEVQLALTHLTHGRLIRQEIEADIVPITSRESALNELRKSNSQFEEIQRTIRKRIPEQRGRSIGEHELSAEQLANLNNNMRFQSALCGINRAQLYPAEDKLNRIDALNVGLEKLLSVRGESNSEQPLWWRVETKRAECLRLLRRFDECRQLLARLPLEKANLATKQAVIEQQIKLVIDSRALRIGPPMAQQVLEIENRSPQLDLALVELMMTLANSTLTNAENWRSSAGNQLRAIEQTHGAYWGRRAELLVIGNSGLNTGGATNPPTNPTQPTAGSKNSYDLLIRIGDQAVRKDRLADAQKAYAEAIAMAESSGDMSGVFSTTVKNAMTYEKQNQNRMAGKQLLALTNKLPQMKNSATAHLRGCWNLRKSAANGRPEQIEELKLALAGHMRLWPESSTTDQANLWSARILQTEKQWKLAADSYLKVKPESRWFETSIQQAIVCIDQLARTSGNEALLQKYSSDLAALLSNPNVSSRGQIRVLLGLAEIGIQHGTVRPEQLKPRLESALSDATADLKTELAPWLILSSSILDSDASKTEAILTQITNNKAALTTLANGLETVAARISKTSNVPKSLRNMQKTTAERALTNPSTDSEKNFWTGKLADALLKLDQNSQAVTVLTELVRQNPKSAGAQLELARALSKIPGETGQTRALKQWRTMASKLKPKSESWFEAKLNVARCLRSLNQQEDALKLLEFLNAIPPGWSKSTWKADLDQLLIDCQN